MTTNVRCDQTSHLSATAFTYSATNGLTYLDQPLMKGPANTPLYLGTTYSTGAKLIFNVAPLVNSTQINIADANGTCIVENSTTALTCTPGGTGGQRRLGPLRASGQAAAAARRAPSPTPPLPPHQLPAPPACPASPPLCRQRRHREVHGGRHGPLRHHDQASTTALALALRCPALPRTPSQPASPYLPAAAAEAATSARRLGAPRLTPRPPCIHPSPRRYGMDLYLMSVKTGLFCRTVDASNTTTNTTGTNTTSTNTTSTYPTTTTTTGAAMPTILCDAVLMANATAFNYQGNALMVDNATIISNATLFINPSEPPRPTPAPRPAPPTHPVHLQPRRAAPGSHTPRSPALLTRPPPPPRSQHHPAGRDRLPERHGVPHHGPRPVQGRV
jgi:hypothetical protein